MADLSKLRFNGTDYNVKDASAPLRKFTNYSKTGNLPITSDDTTQTAIGKLENALNSKINTSAKGTSNGVAELDANGKVPSSQLPSYVDDVLEYSAKSSFPATGETGKIYVDTTTNKTYRWSGSAYVEISESLALGETSSTAYRGDRGKAAYDHSQVTSGNPHGTTGANTKLTGYSKGSSKDAVAATDTVNAAIAKHENRIDTNQSNILYVLNKSGSKNVLVPKYDKFTNNEVSYTVNADGTITVVIASTTASNRELPLTDVISNVYDGMIISGSPSGTNIEYLITGLNSDDTYENEQFSYNQAHSTINRGTPKIRFSIYVKSGTTAQTVTFYPMVQDASITDFTFAKPALPNYDLTYLQAEDRAALIEEIDSGAKNLIDTPTVTVAGITFTADSDHYITASPNHSDPREYTYAACQWKTHLKKGNYVLAIDIKTATSRNSATVALLNSSSTIVATINNNQLINKTGIVYSEFTVTTEGDYGVIMKCYAMVARLMLCTKAAFGVSPKFVPFGNDPSYQVSINHNMIYRGRNLGASLTDAQHTALSSGNFTDLYLGDYWTKTVTIPAGTYTGGDGEEVTVPAQTNITLKAVIADFDTFYAGYASTYAGINTHHAAVIVTGFSNVVWNKTNSTAGGYVASLIHKWLVGSALPQIETWFGSAKVLSHQKLLTNAITGDAASGWAWSSQKISLLSENQMYGSKVWGNSKAANGGYEPGEAFKHLNVFNHIDANLLFGDRVIWLRDIASAVWVAGLNDGGDAGNRDASYSRVAPAALILLS